jgi:hypothetical protein
VWVATSARWPFLEKFVRRGMPRTICITYIVAHRWGVVGERVVPSGFVHSGAQGPVLEHLFLSGVGDAFINDRLADQRLAIWRMH